MRIKKNIFILFLFFSALNAKTVEVLHLGKTYNFAEDNFITAIHKYIKTHKKEIQKRAEKIKKEAKQKIINFMPPGIDPLTPAPKTRTFEVNMTYTLPYDIKDANGKVIYPKGFTFNPARYVHLAYKIVIINADRKDEVKWIANSRYIKNPVAYRIFLTGGNYYRFMKRFKIPVYYCLSEIEKKFHLKHTPSIVWQDGDKIFVKEICIHCKKKQK